MQSKHHNPDFLEIDHQTPLDSNRFFNELSMANLNLGRMDGSMKQLKNPELLIAPLSTKEATVSSAIEGTISTVSDVYVHNAGGSAHRDTPEVFNYRRAIYQAIEDLGAGRKLNTHFIESLHETLLRNTRRKGQTGRFRKETVFLATKESDKIEQATYVPPDALKLRDYMDNWVDYVLNGQDNPLIKAGLLHYQFEAVHPFSDGNGRIGRLLIPLVLYQHSTLSFPVIYMSGYFNQHREEYISALHEVDLTRKYENWLKFFFTALAEQANETQSLIDQITKLYDQTRERFSNIKSSYLIPFIDYIFEEPVFTIPRLQQRLNAKSRITITKLLEAFEGKGQVSRMPFQVQRTYFYTFDPLLEIL